MGERADGRWAARLIGVSAPRQQGKSQLIVARALAGVLLFDEQTIICSAHQTDTAREVFQRLLDIIESNPSLERRVDSVMKAINREHIRFKSGQVIRIKARSLSGGRGFSCDCLLLDEAQILGTPAWSSILPTMSARENPQAWLLGTPPTPQDDGEVFTRLRSAGLEGKDSRMAWVEWSADEDDDLDDVATWAKANPALGSRISVEAIESERSAMTDEQFALERLGMWESASASSVIDPITWHERADEASMAVERLSLAIAISPDRSVATVALAGQRFDGDWHVEIDEQRSGTGWVVEHVAQRCARNEIRAVVIDGASQAVSLTDELREKKVKVTVTGLRDLAAACGAFYDHAHQGGMWHIDQPLLNASNGAAGKRAVFNGEAWVWTGKHSALDITPTQAVTLALWGAQNSNVTKPTRKKTGGRRVITA